MNSRNLLYITQLLKSEFPQIKIAYRKKEVEGKKNNIVVSCSSGLIAKVSPQSELKKKDICDLIVKRVCTGIGWAEVINLGEKGKKGKEEGVKAPRSAAYTQQQQDIPLLLVFV